MQNKPYGLSPASLSDYESAVVSSLGIDDETLRMLLDTFFTSIKTDMQALKAFVFSCDYRNTKSKAHEIKGAAGSMRFDSLAGLLQELEHSAVRADKDSTIRTFHEIEDELDRVTIICLAKSIFS